MISIDRILCPTDFSKYADHALSYGVEFAKQFKATLHLHHSISIPYMAVAYEIGPDVAAVRDAAEAEAKKRLDEKREALQAEGIAVETHLTVGTPFVDIVTRARDLDVDMIILATHGWGAIKQLILGSTAERVVRKAPCPVLTIKQPEREFVMP